MHRNRPATRRVCQALVLAALCMAANAGPSIDESYPYFEDIVLGLGIDASDSDVWDIGNAEYRKGERVVGMSAYYRKPPKLYRNDMCVVERRSRTASIDGDGFSWSEESKSYRVWLLSVHDCNLKRPDEIPESSSVSDDVTLQEAYRVLQNEHYLFQEVLNRSPGMFDHWGTYRLSRIDKTNRASGFEGQVLIHAQFVSPGRHEGPTVLLRIEDDIIRVKIIGFWIS